MSAPILFSLGASAGIITTIDWMLERATPVVDTEISADAHGVSIESNGTDSGSRSLASIIQSQSNDHEVSLRKDDTKPSSPLSPVPTAIVEVNPNEDTFFHPKDFASASPATSAPRRAAEQIPAGTLSSFGGESSGLVISDVPVNGASSSGGPGGTSTGDPMASALGAVRSTDLSAGGIAFQPTPSGHKVSASFGVTMNLVRGKSASGHEVRWNTPGLHAD